ncbi:MAG TPA: aspartyl/asparaginyl beta-hydroxylase domain-containing protein [Caulobacteraceae bacterium]
MQQVSHYLLQPRLLILALLVLSATAVHLRGRVRLKFARQLTDHSTFVAPYNAFAYLTSKTARGPYLEAGAFPELSRLTDNWQVIRDEGLRLMDEGMVRGATANNDIGFHTFFKRGWKRFYLKWYDDPQPSAERLCPKTVALLDQVPSVHGAMFATLPPGGRLGAHRDPFAGSLRYHLGLRTPNSDACWIEVDGRRYSWRDGEAVVFDETYVHTALNATDVTRLILFCDIERPLWGPAAAINRWVMRHIMRATATQNVEGERVGAINRAFGTIFAVKEAGQQLKARNRRLYYALKYAVIAAALALLLWPY